MAEKASLMIASSKKAEELEAVEEAIEKLKSQIEELPTACLREKASAKEDAQREFNDKRKNCLQRIRDTVEKKREEVAGLLDSFPDLEEKEFAGKCEIKELEAHLRELYPQAMLDSYIGLNPIEFDSDADAFRTYSALEGRVLALSGGNMTSAIFVGLTRLLDFVTQDVTKGIKIAGCILLGTVGLTIFLPFAILTLYAALGVIAMVYGLVVSQLLRKLSSVKLYLNDSYDEDIFARDREDILESVEEYLSTAEKDYLDRVTALTFVFDEDVLKHIEAKYDADLERLKDNVQQELVLKGEIQEEITAIITELEALIEAEKQRALEIQRTYLQNIEWKSEWLSEVLVDVTAESSVKMLKYTAGNSVYYASEVEPLQQLSQLIIYQSLLRMHPDYASNIVLDYKYMGGALTQFLDLPSRSCAIAISLEDITAKVTLICNDIKARTKNILPTCADLDTFNSMMREYGGSGETYTVVHLFGLTSFTDELRSAVKNGARVGYFFKFYWTVPELKALGNKMLYDDLQDFFEVFSTPMPRTMGAFKRIVEPPS